jgi:CheY-like chemotaxis protein
MAGSEKHFRQKGEIHMKKQVMIADADEQFRNELVVALEGNEEFEVMGVATDGEEALQMLQTKQVDILVIDLLLPQYDGLTILESIQTINIRPRVLVLKLLGTVAIWILYNAILVIQFPTSRGSLQIQSLSQ